MSDSQDYTRIFLDDVLVEAHVGFSPWEKYPEKRVPLLVSVDLIADRAHWPDYRLESLIDYSRVYKYLMTWPDRPHVESLEALCDDLLAFCFQDERVTSCRVRLKKPHVVANSSGLGVEIFRNRPIAAK